MLRKIIEKYHISSLSEVRLRTKLRLVNIIAVTAAFIMAAIMFINVLSLKNKSDKSMEKTMVSTADSILKMELDNAVSIARNIYGDHSMYEFFDTEYSSSSKYYEAYYQFQNSNPLTKSELNTIKNYTIYTENPTILPGGIIDTVDSIRRSEWFQNYNKYDKAMLMYCDPQTATISLIRKMDFDHLIHGDCYLKIDINTVLLKAACDDLDFDGDLYVFSSGTMIYSNSEKSDYGDIGIDRHYECLTKNYYSADFEYYANATKYSFADIIKGNIIYFILFLLIITAAFILAHLFSADVMRRTEKCKDTFEHDGSLLAIKNGECGSDEIGQLADICSALSDKLSLRISETSQNDTAAQATNFDYNALFGTAMRLNAELNVRELHPSLVKDSYSEMITLAEEAEMVKGVGKALSKARVYVADDTKNKKAVPAYSIMLIADNLLRLEGNPSLSLECEGNRVILYYENDVKPSPMRILKLNAIFEKADISNEYSFKHKNIYNPYLRLKYLFGDNATLEMETQNGFKLTITLIINTEMSDE